MKERAKLTNDEREELAWLENLQKSKTRFMSQGEYDRLKFLGKVDFSGCRNNCKAEDWSKDGQCGLNGCYQDPTIFVLDESNNLVQIQ